MDLAFAISDEELEKGYRIGSCCRKNRTISAEASGPLGSVYEPERLPPDQACPSP
jgi:hypothetical protein